MNPISVQFDCERISVMVGAIRGYLAEADRAAMHWDQREPATDEKALIKFSIERAFLELLVLLESAGLTALFRIVEALNVQAREDYTAAAVYDSELYLIWSEKLNSVLTAIQHAFDASETTTITRDVAEILRACEYVITDPYLFQHSPARENDVHLRIESILRVVFPDLVHKPRINKPLKHFEPDTGLPSQKILIEYKYVNTQENVKTVSEQLLTDALGFASSQWNHMIFVVYETRRLRSEKTWRAHLRACRVTGVSILVLRGEAQPSHSKELKKNTRKDTH